MVEGTEHFPQPNLHDMFHVSDTFYKDMITSAYKSSEEEISVQKKRMSKLPSGMPKKLDSLDEIFKDKKYFSKIMSRSKVLTERLQKQYMDKLRRKFDEITPMIRNGDITPKEAKSKMMEAWGASKSRVETIFRTETTTYFAKTQTAFFEGNDDIIGYLFDSVSDASRTEGCRSRHGLVYRPGTKLLRDNTPACHWNCRSELIALANTAGNRRMLLDPQRDPSKRSVAPLPRGWRK